MPQQERAEICTCTHLRYEEHVPPFGRCLIEDCGCLEYKSAALNEPDMPPMCPYGGSHTAADCECDPHYMRLSPAQQAAEEDQAYDSGTEE